LLDHTDLEHKVNQINNYETKINLKHKIKELSRFTNDIGELQDILKKYSSVPKVDVLRYEQQVQSNDKDLQSYLRIETENNNFISNKSNRGNTNDYEVLYYDPFIGEDGTDIKSQPNDLVNYSDYQKVGNDVTHDRKTSSKLFVANYRQLKRPNKLVTITPKLNKLKGYKMVTRKNLNQITFFEETAQRKPITVKNMNSYINEDLIERIYFCSQSDTITLDANESNKIGILLLDYLRVEEENKIKSIEYENAISEFVEKYEEEVAQYNSERGELLRE
jgi:hypothetical protein